MTKRILLFTLVSAVLGLSQTIPVSAKDDKGQSCLKRQMAKGLSECIAKAKCNGVTSRKDQARMCP
jgi:hypothetical protein